MRKRKFLFNLLLVLSIVSFMGLAWSFRGRSNVVSAVKTGNNKEVSNDKKRIKKKIICTKRALGALVNRNKKLKKWQNMLNMYINIKEKGLKDFENKMIENLAHELNQNISHAKYIMRCFGCSDHLTNLIFEDNKDEQNNGKSSINIKFKKIMCCPEIIVQIEKKFNSAEELRKFRENVWHEKVFLCANGENNICKMCIILVNTNTINQ